MFGYYYYTDMCTKGSSEIGFKPPDNYPCFEGRLLTLSVSWNWVETELKGVWTTSGVWVIVVGECGYCWTGTLFTPNLLRD